MKKLMSIALAAFLTLLGHPAWAACTELLHVVYTTAGAAYVTSVGGTLSSVTASIVAQVNGPISATSVGGGAYLSSTIYVGSTFANPVIAIGSTGSLADTLNRAKDSPGVMGSRDAYGADQVFVIDAPSLSLTGLTGLTPAPYVTTSKLASNSISVFDASQLIGYGGTLLGGDYTFAREWSRQVGSVNSDGQVTKTGTTSSTCEVDTTVDYIANPSYDYAITTSVACWGFSSPGTCYGSGHAGILAQVAAIEALGYSGCSYTGYNLNAPSTTSWAEQVGCPGWGSAVYTDYYYGTTPSSFVCPSINTTNARVFSYGALNKIYNAASQTCSLRYSPANGFTLMQNLALFGAAAMYLIFGP